jgi:hypothetical protein
MRTAGTAIDKRVAELLRIQSVYAVTVLKPCFAVSTSEIADHTARRL